ncbi:MAG: hypothetical protein R3E08_06275 [Thiotrichaceae bacterium]
MRNSFDEMLIKVLPDDGANNRFNDVGNRCRGRAAKMKYLPKVAAIMSERSSQINEMLSFRVDSNR